MIHKIVMTDFYPALTDYYSIITTFSFGQFANNAYLCTVKSDIPSKMQIITFHTRFRLLGLLLLLVVNSVTSSRAQYLISEHILINEGMSNNFILDMVLDNKGRLWVATESGLNAYNGSSFRSYNVSNSELSANMVNCLWYDEATDLVWAGTKGAGVCSVDPNTGVLTNYMTADGTLTNVLDITPADNQRLWLISPNTIMQFEPQTGKIEPLDLGPVSQYFRCGVDDGNGNLVIGSHMHGASVLNARTHKLESLIIDDMEDQRINVNEVIKDHRGRIWLATNVGLWFYLPGSNHLVPFHAIPREDISHIEEIDDSNLWVTMRGKTLTVNLNDEQVTTIHFDGEYQMFDEVQSLYQDRHGNIWVGGNGNGIEFISHQMPAFRKFFDAPSWGIYADGDITWVGTENHVIGFKGTHMVRDFKISTPTLSYGPVISINGDGKNLLYLAVRNHCLALDKNTGKVSTITTPEGKDIDAITFYREEDGTFWITTVDGIYTLSNGKAVECQPINQQIHRQSLHGIRRDKQGKIWVATYENGIYLFDSDFKLIRNLSQQTGFVSNSIQHLKFDSQDRLWMSTPDGPCCIPHTRYPDQYMAYGYSDGLHDTSIRAIQEDKNGNIWMSTNNGISMLNFATQRFVNYNQSDYLPINNMNGGSLLLADGSIIFNSMQGLCLCYPDSLTSAQPPVSFNLLSMQLLSQEEAGNNQIVLPDAKGVYHLEPEKSSFRLFFGATDYAHSQYMEYEYQTDNDGRRWTPCSRGVVTFRDLRPGSYNIRVRARTKGQAWSEQNVITTRIQIHQPWWWTFWAKALYLLIAIGTLTIIILHYLHRLRLTSELELERRKNLVEHEHNAERLQFFTNVTHELKTPLTLIQAPLEELLQDDQLPPAVKKRIQLVYDSSCRLTDLCNKLLDFRKTETNNHHLKVSLGNLGDLVKEVGQSFIELNTNPDLQFVVDIEEPQQHILFDGDVIRSILTNLLSNAVKYTPKGTIRLQMRQQQSDGRLLTLLSVSDTGYGIPASSLPHIFDRYYQVSGPHQASGTGIGLSIVKSLAELHKAQIKAESQEGAGSTFTLILDGSQTYPDAMHAQSKVEVQAEKEAVVTDIHAEDDTRPILLLVEDDYQILNFMADALNTDYRILRAHNGQEGLDLATEHIPDIVITDLMMPVMNGNALCRKLKNDLRTSHIPVIMLTAKDTDDDKMEGYADGADSYLTKPFSLLMLRTRLQNILSARSRMMAWVNAQGLQPTSNGMAQPEASASEEAPMPTLSTYDQNFLRDVKAYIIEHIETDNIRMEDLAQSMHISHSTLYRKIKALTGQSGTEFIRKVRILHSAELLRSGHCNVSEAAYRCGFSNLAYFRTAFKESFGVTPSEYQKQ